MNRKIVAALLLISSPVAAQQRTRPAEPLRPPTCEELRARGVKSGVTQVSFGAPLVLSGILGAIGGAVILAAASDEEGGIAVGTGALGGAAVSLIVGGILVGSGRGNIDLGMLMQCPAPGPTPQPAPQIPATPGT